MVRRLAVLAGMVVVVALLFVAGCKNLQSRRTEIQQAQQKVAVTQSAGTDYSGPAGEPLPKGKPAPGFALKGLDGKTVSLADYKGKPVVVNFWATWCGPCKLEMPWFEEFHTKYKDQGLTVLGISDDPQQAKDEIVKAAKKLGVTYPLLLPDDKVTKAYGGVEYYPETFYVDKNGVVVAETSGAPTKDEMEANIKKVIAVQ